MFSSPPAVEDIFISGKRKILNVREIKMAHSSFLAIKRKGNAAE